MYKLFLILAISIGSTIPSFAELLKDADDDFLESSVTILAPGTEFILLEKITIESGVSMIQLSERQGHNWTGYSGSFCSLKFDPRAEQREILPYVKDNVDQTIGKYILANVSTVYHSHKSSFPFGGNISDGISYILTFEGPTVIQSLTCRALGETKARDLLDLKFFEIKIKLESIPKIVR